MKKSMIIPLCGIILVFMFLQVMSNKKDVYVKTKNYEVKEEAIADFIGYSNVYENIMDVDGYSNVYSNAFSNEFNESISLRYRTFIKNDHSRNIFGGIPFMLEYSLEKVEDEYITEKYEDTFKLIEGYKRSEDITYFNLTGKGVGVYKTIDKSKIKKDGTVDAKDLDLGEDYYTEELSLYIVVVDEGEGYVVDYYERIY